MRLKYRIKRFLIKWTRKEKDLDLSDVQKKAYDITIKLINDQESNLMYDPIKHRRCIRKGDVFITLSKNKLSVINGVYYYDISIDDRIQDNIINKFNTKLHRKINATENKIKLNVKSSLDSILEEISK